MIDPYLATLHCYVRWFTYISETNWCYRPWLNSDPIIDGVGSDFVRVDGHPYAGFLAVNTDVLRLFKK